MTAARIERLRAELDRLGAASFLVSDPVNVLYLTGFESSNAFVLVKHKRVLLFTDGRYIDAARAVEGIEPVQLERELAADLGPRLSELADAPVAFEADAVTFATHQALAQGGVELVPATGIVKGLRAVKEEDELDAVRRSARILNETYERLARETLVGRTESEVAWWIEQVLHEEGAEDVSFDPIVGSGPNGALPHHHPGGRTIERGELVIVDAGAKVEGYCSDCTRTFAPLTSRTSSGVHIPFAGLRRSRLSQRCARVQTRAASTRSPGTRSRLPALPRSCTGSGTASGSRSTSFRCFATADGRLEPGNAVTVEPGVYLPGVGGVRIEDLVIVDEDGAEVLTPFTKDLLTLD